MISTALLKLAGAALVVTTTGLTVYSLASDPQSVPHRYYRSYLAHLEHTLRSMFIPVNAAHIVAGQAFGLVLATWAGLGLGFKYWWALLPMILYGPTLYLTQMKKDRIRECEQKLDAFILTLANSLRATPSLANALSYTQPLIGPPLSLELSLVLKEVRLGNTLEQSLLNMSSRVQSAHLDATLAGLLIGRQIGGDLPKILETTAQTLRDMQRLQGVLKAKTADSRIQIWALTMAPPLVLIVFDFLKPGYFKPLTASAMGLMVSLVAGLLWAASMLLARRLLKVDL